MSEPYVGEVRLVPYNFAPVEWFFCQGQLLPISEYATLFNLIGTTYGGDGQNTFALPDLRGRVPIHQGTGGGNTYVMGQIAGAETVTLTVNQTPAHTHTVMASGNSAGPVSNPTNNVLGAAVNMYSAQAPSDPMNPAMVSVFQGGNQPHNNLQPFLALNWIISLFGVYPSQA